LRRLEHVYGVPWKKTDGGAVSLREKRLFLLNLSEGEDQLRNQLIEERTVPCLTYMVCCLCPFVGGIALYCAYQSIANHEAARENFLRGHRLGFLAGPKFIDNFLNKNKAQLNG